MLQELAADSGAAYWAIGSMLFFLAVWLAIVVWTMRRRREDMDARARLPLDEHGESKSEGRCLDLDK